LLAELNVSADVIAKHTKITAVFAVKTTSKWDDNGTSSN
jgi:hypothetical protein